jgi:PAS domain S-box-containing protein
MRMPNGQLHSDALAPASTEADSTTTGSPAVPRRGAVAETVVREILARAGEGDARYRVLAELSPDGLLVNADGRLVYANPAAARLLGFADAGEVVGRDPLEFIQPEYHDMVRARLARAAEAGTVPPEEYPWLRPDGRVVWVEAAGARTVWAGRPAVQVVFRDASARRRAEAALRRSRERLRAVLENTLDAPYRRNLRTDTYDYIAPRLQAMVGVPTAALMAMSQAELLQRVHPEDRQRVEQALQHGSSAGTAKVDYRFVHADGSCLWLSDQFTTQCDSDGVPRFRTGVLRDVTERKLAEEAVREGRERIDRQNAVLNGIAHIFGAALSSTTEEELGVVCLDVAARVTGSAFGIMCGVEPANGDLRCISVHGRCGGDAPASADGEAAEQPDAVPGATLHGLGIRVLREGASLISNRVAAAGQPAPRCFLGVPLVHGGRTIGMLGLADRNGGYGPAEREMAEALAPAIVQALLSTRAEQELRHAKDAAERASRVKGQFLSTMSHELRTPLTAIIGLSDLLETDVAGPTTGKQKDYLARIKSSAWHLAAIIDEILTFSRTDAGKEQVRLAEVDVAEIARGVVMTLSAEAEARGLALRLAGADGRMTVIADGGKLRQVLINLVGNALKYTEHGSVDVELDAAGDGMAIHVRDTGPGIPADRCDDIFEPFVQGDQSSTRSRGGTGLGLTVARRLARLMGGDVVVASTPGLGSTFTMRLPAQLPLSIVAEATH